MNDILLSAFHNELEKIAVSAKWVRRRLGAGPTLNVPLPKGLERVRARDGHGAIGKRYQLAEALKSQGGYAAEVQAPALRKRTKEQLNNIENMLYKRRQEAPRPVLSTNPTSIAKARAFAGEMDAYDDVLGNVVSRKKVNRLFGDEPEWG